MMCRCYRPLGAHMKRPAHLPCLTMSTLHKTRGLITCQSFKCNSYAHTRVCDRQNGCAFASVWSNSVKMPLSHPGGNVCCCFAFHYSTDQLLCFYLPRQTAAVHAQTTLAYIWRPRCWVKSQKKRCFRASEVTVTSNYHSEKTIESRKTLKSTGHFLKTFPLSLKHSTMQCPYKIKLKKRFNGVLSVWND